jgi:pimeloyl-ACP methyl ester carboxylesterase
MAGALGTPVAQPGLEAMAGLPIEAPHAHSVRLAGMWTVRPQVRDFSFDLWVHFEAVIDAAGFPQVSLLGTCQGGPIAIEYAARDPERLAKLALYENYARGLARRRETAQAAEKAKILLDMLRLGR